MQPDINNPETWHKGHLNVLERDHDSACTGFGKHDRVVVFQPDHEGLYCRIDLKHGLGMPTHEEILKVARAWPNDIKGQWVFDRQAMHADGQSIDIYFQRVQSWNVHIGYTDKGRDKWKKFSTLESAQVFCNEVHEKTGKILTIIRKG